MWWRWTSITTAKCDWWSSTYLVTSRGTLTDLIASSRRSWYVTLVVFHGVSQTRARTIVYRWRSLFSMSDGLWCGRSSRIVSHGREIGLFSSIDCRLAARLRVGEVRRGRANSLGVTSGWRRWWDVVAREGRHWAGSTLARLVRVAVLSIVFGVAHSHVLEVLYDRTHWVCRGLWTFDSALLRLFYFRELQLISREEFSQCFCDECSILLRPQVYIERM